MVGVLYGFLWGVFVASIVLVAAARFRPEQRQKFASTWFDVLVMAAVAIVSLTGVVDPPRTLSVIHVALGAIAGFLFRGLISFAAHNLLVGTAKTPRPAAAGDPPPAPQTPPPASAPKPAGETSWWSTEPWRSVALIATLMMAAAAIPLADNFLSEYEFNKLQLGNLQLEVTKISSDLRKLTRDQNRQRINADRLGDFVDKKAMTERIESDSRYLEHAAARGLLSAQLATDGRKGNEAFLDLFGAVLNPFARCVAALSSDAAGELSVRQLVADFTREYRRHIGTGKRAEVIAADVRASPVDGGGKSLHEATMELMKSKASVHPDCAGTGIKAPDAGKRADLKHAPWADITLASLYYYGGDRMAAVEVLSEAALKFPYNMNVFALLAVYWYAEGHTSAMAIDASWRFMQLAHSFKQVADSAQVADPTKRTREMKGDVTRGIKAVALAENAWAYHVATSDRESDSVHLPQAIQAAKHAAEASFSLTAAAREMPDGTPVEQLALEDGSLFWSSVDTYAAALMAASPGKGKPDSTLPCVADILRKAQSWWAAQLDNLVSSCAQGLGCSRLKKHYASTAFSYEVVSRHVRFAADSLKRRGLSHTCEPSEGAKLLKALWPQVQSPQLWSGP